MAPASSKTAARPSRARVARTCSDPGVTVNGTRAVIPAPTAWRATAAARRKSSYDASVHDPIRPASSARGQPCSCTAPAKAESGHARPDPAGP